MKKRHIGMFFAISMLALTQIGTSAHALLTSSVQELHFIDIMNGVKSVSQTVTFENRDSEDAKILSASSSEKDLTGSFQISFTPNVILKPGEKITLQVSLVSRTPELVVDEENKNPIKLVLNVQRPSGNSSEGTVLLKAYKSGTGISGSPWPLAFLM